MYYMKIPKTGEKFLSRFYSGAYTIRYNKYTLGIKYIGLNLKKKYLKENTTSNNCLPYINNFTLIKKKLTK